MNWVLVSIGRQAATFLSRCCLSEQVDVLVVVQGTVDFELLEVDLCMVVRGTVHDELLAAPTCILCVEKPVNILTKSKVLLVVDC